MPGFRRFDFAIVALAAFAVLLLSGCGGGGSYFPADTVTTTGQYGSLRIALTTRSVVAAGKTVPLTLRVTNVGAQTVATMISLPESDAQVVQNGQSVWRWSDGQAFPAGIYSLSLAPGETKTYTLDWDQKDSAGNLVAPGVYSAQAWFNAIEVDGATVSPQNDLAVTPVEITIR